jgi:hypothetical protein
MARALWFGKYKGRTIADVLVGDPEYLQWLCSQDEFRNNHRAFYLDIIDCVEGLIDAPGRKAMRTRFHDVDFCRRFLQASGQKAILLHGLEGMHAKALGGITDRLQDLREATDLDDSNRQAAVQRLHTLQKRIPNQIEAFEPKISCRFEQRGFDVVMRASIRYPWEPDLRKHYLGSRDGGVKSTVAIKIRGTVGNNYPATIRWIGTNRIISSGWNRGGSRPIADHVVLLVGRFNRNNAVKEQFVGEAAAANIKVVFAADLEAP